MRLNKDDLQSYRAHVLAAKLGVDVATARRIKNGEADIPEGREELLSPPARPEIKVDEE